MTQDLKKKVETDINQKETLTKVSNKDKTLDENTIFSIYFDFKLVMITDKVWFVGRRN